MTSAAAGSDHDRYVCVECGTRAAAPGRCPRCEDETLLDTEDVHVQELLSRRTDYAIQRGARRQTIGALAVMAGWCVGVTLGSAVTRGST